MNTTENMTVDIDLTKPIVGYCALCGRALSKRQWRFDYTPKYLGYAALTYPMICRARGLCARRQEQQRKEKA